MCTPVDVIAFSDGAVELLLHAETTRTAAIAALAARRENLIVGTPSIATSCKGRVDKCEPMLVFPFVPAAKASRGKLD
jgi:hypothetical protein